MQENEAQEARHMPIDYEALLAKQAEEIAKRVSAPSGDNIRVNQDKTFTFPDGSSSPGPFKAVIVDFISGNYYYPTSYNPKDVTPPDCYALGPEPALLVPSIKSLNKQSESCAVCPNNQWGSGGGNGKACRNHRLLAVLPPDATDESPLWILKLSPTAIKHFDAYVLKVSRQFQSPPVKVVSEIGFDPEQTYPVIRFGRPEPNTNFLYFASRMEEARTRLLVEPDAVKVEERTAPPLHGKTKTRR